MCDKIRDGIVIIFCLSDFIGMNLVFCIKFVIIVDVVIVDL